MTNADENTPHLSSGVDALIARLRDEGVLAGRAEADDLVTEAKARARQIVEKANEEARTLLDRARKEASAYRSAGEDAVKAAMRDTVLEMKSDLMQRFSSDVRRLAARELQDEDLLKTVVLEVAGRAREAIDASESKQIEVILPEKVAGLAELRNKPEELRNGRLTHYVLGLSGEMLREGVTFATGPDLESGVRIHLVDDEITLELTDEAIGALLLRHLQPRFRAILEGIIK
jgi:V/A-type H+/Na+-transporting ATPase subunit E